ncbi:GNAT family N-acetyltransferase [Streptomyces sp. NPDC059009]|uniref:GNAT family N-acetyltransferase n=1 Tax=Streptomyces sp. NPDC059009 TaxID=3346694 RepID=UPI003673BF91
MCPVGPTGPTGPIPVRLEGDALTLREWTDDDLPAMVELFDEEEVAHRTPLASPFDLEAARGYLEMIRRARATGERLHLAVAVDGDGAGAGAGHGDVPVGEVLLNLQRGTMGYAIGAAHRGQGLARRAVDLLTAYAHDTLGLARVVLQIEPDNAGSIAVARATGYRLSSTDEPEWVKGKAGRTYQLISWEHLKP